MPQTPAKTSKPRRRGLLLDAAQLADELGERERTIATLRKKGAIPYLSLGHRTVRFKLADVLAALEKRTIKPRNARA
ncbi:MAG: helix-turn-helix transcriptional regulator [Chthoniobacterales bacterium]